MLLYLNTELQSLQDILSFVLGILFIVLQM